MTGEGGEASRTRGATDKTLNKKGTYLLDLLAKRGWSLLNGNVSGDEKGDLTFSRGGSESTIDYAIVNEESWEEVEEMRVVDRVRPSANLSRPGKGRVEWKEGDNEEEHTAMERRRCEEVQREYREGSLDGGRCPT